MTQVADATTATTTTAATAAAGHGRYLYVDALRGIAALAVVAFHVVTVTALAGTFRRSLPAAVTFVLGYGDRGVEVFFVISGFVIAHSLRRVRPTGAGAVNFILRRQLRLDPPYWAMIAITLAVMAAQHRRGGPPVPTGWGIALNLAYLQHAVRHQPHVLAVAWTLCLEVQFYLAFIALTAAGFRLGGRRANPGPWAVALVLASGLGCLAVVRHPPNWGAGLPTFWPYFVFGAACEWAVHDLLPAWAWAAYAAAFAAATVAVDPVGPTRSYMVVGLVTAASLYAAGRLGRLRTLGSNPVLQYLGRVSYSLYLVHLLVASTVAQWAVGLPHGGGRRAAWLWFAATIGASVAAADVFHRLVERPSMRWAASFRRKAATDGTTAVDPPAAAAA